MLELDRLRLYPNGRETRVEVSWTSNLETKEYINITVSPGSLNVAATGALNADGLEAFNTAMNISMAVLYKQVVQEAETSEILRQQTEVKAQRREAMLANPLSFIALSDNNARLYFVWAYPDSKLSEKVRELIGAVLAKYILFGKVMPRSNSSQVIKTAQEFEAIAKILWQEVEAITLEGRILPREAEQVAKDAIARYKQKLT